MSGLRGLGAALMTALLVAFSATAPVAAATSTTSEQHTYDDGHTDDAPSGSGLALWILLGAVTGLASIGGVLIWSGHTSSRQ